MKYTIENLVIWCGPVEDRPGGLAVKLEALHAAGAALEFLDASRGSGMMFVAPVKGAKQIRAARKAGLVKADMMQAVRISGGDAPGLGARICQVLGDDGISFRALAAAAIGRQATLCFAFDSREDARRAVRLLRRLLNT